MRKGIDRDLSGGSETSADDDGVRNLLAMQMQRNQYQPYVSITEIWTVWSLVDSMCYDVNGRDNQGVPPIIYAAKRGSIILLRLLLNYLADVNSLSAIRETAVMAACRKQKIGAVKFLIQRGARLDLCDKSQFSALRWAATHGDVSLVRLLLRHNVSVRLDCCTPNSALEIATSYPTTAHAKVVLLLQRHLVIERRHMLEALRQQHEREEIEQIKKYRRKMKSEARHAGATSGVDNDAKISVNVNVERSPFGVPIVPSLKGNAPRRNKSNEQNSEDRHGSISKHQPNDTKPLKSVQGLLSTQSISPPAMVWTKVARGIWRQVEPRPQKSASSVADDADAVLSLTPAGFDQSQITAEKVFASESKWQSFLVENAQVRRNQPPHDHAACWQLDNLDT